MAYKVVKAVDKFNDKTTVTMNKEYKISKNVGVFSYGSKFKIRHLSMPDVDSIFLDYYFEDSGNKCDFLYLDDGDLIIRINNRENISLPFIATGERDISSYEDNNGQTHTTRTEYNFVEIDKITLEKICNANSIELKLNGENPIEYSANKCFGLIEYCKVFYEGLYNTDINKLEVQVNKSSNNTINILMIIIGIILGGVGMALSISSLVNESSSGLILAGLSFIAGLTLSIVYGIKLYKG